MNLSMALIWFLMIVQIYDVAQTLYILKRGGYEENVVLKWLMDRIGIAPVLFAKAGVVIAILWFTREADIWTTTYGQVILAGLSVLYFWFVVVKNTQAVLAIRNGTTKKEGT